MPCCPWPWDNSRHVAVVGSGEERPQPPTIVLPRFSVSLPSCSQRDPHWPWTRGDAGSAGAPAPPPAQSWVQIPALPLTHCGTPWELPLEDLLPPFLGENKQRTYKDALAKTVQRGLFPCAHKTGRGAPHRCPSLGSGPSSLEKEERMGWVRGEAWSTHIRACARTHLPRSCMDTHTRRTDKKAHIQTHTLHRPLPPPAAPQPSPPLYKLPVPSSVPRNHLPNIRILKNMARF